MELTVKQKMLGAALYARHSSRQTAVTILMVLENDDQIDDLTWYMGEHPQASDDELIAVAYQLVKDANTDNKGE